MKRLPSDKTYLFIIAFFLIIFTAWTLPNVGVEIIQPSLCHKCHEMDNNISQWHRTTHSKINCINCHETKLGFYTLKHLLNDKEYLASKTVTISDHTCRRCHSVNRKVSPPWGLNIPHTNHYKRINCIECHYKVGHTSESTRVPKAKCISCHDGKKAPSSCITCHKKPERQ